MSSEYKQENTEEAVAAAPRAQRTILLTGARGALGAQLATYLKPLGYNLHALVRSPSSTTGPEFSKVLDWTSARDDDAALGELLGGVDSVIHLASSQSKHPEQQEEAHLHMPNRLLSVGAQVGLSQFIALSSVKAIAGEATPQCLTVDQTPQPSSAYGNYKLAAERVVREHPANAKVATWLLRLPIVYGPNAGGNFELLRKVARWGLPLPVASDNRRSWLYIENLFSLLDKLLQQPAAATVAKTVAKSGEAPSQVGANTLHVADPQALSTRALLQLIADAEGGRMRGITLPSQWAERFAGVPILGGVLTRLLGSLELDVTSLERFDDWQLPFTTEAGVMASIQPAQVTPPTLAGGKV